MFAGDTVFLLSERPTEMLQSPFSNDIKHRKKNCHCNDLVIYEEKTQKKVV